MNSNERYAAGIVAKAIVYKDELAGTQTGDYLKMLVNAYKDPESREGFYFPQLIGAVMEAEDEIKAKEEQA